MICIFCQANVEPGTVVDTQIVRAKEMDFYLQSHAVIQLKVKVMKKLWTEGGYDNFVYLMDESPIHN